MAISLRTATMDIVRGTRGRPSAPWHSIFDVVSLTYLVRVSKKYEIETSKLLECVHGAWLQGESSFGDISIRRRQMIGDDGIFLITQNGKILTQLRLTSKLLEYLGKIDISNLQFEDYPLTKRNRLEPEDLEIKDLSSDIKRFNLEAKVTEKSTPKIIFSRLGKELLLSTVTIKDGSGTIKLPLWNDQIDMISVGDRVHIENARLKRFRGELQVRVGKFTKLQVIRKQ
jgi:replication factor A1